MHACPGWWTRWRARTGSSCAASSGRVTKLDRPTVAEAKAYCAGLAPIPDTARAHAGEVFARLLASPVVRTRIDNFVHHQRMPWEG